MTAPITGSGHGRPTNGHPLSGHALSGRPADARPTNGVPSGAATRSPHARPGHPVVIAHRGASGYRPEHTADAFRLAAAQGADALEPDVVATADGVLVVRHENELSATTDVADHPEYAGRRTTKEVDGRTLTGWFTEDFTWPELATLRARERVPALRPENAQLDGRWPLLRLADLLELAVRVMDDAGRPLQVVAEVKSPTYLASVGLPLAELFDAELAVAGLTASRSWLTVECFEKSFLLDVAARGLGARRVYLTKPYGAAFDVVTRDGDRARTYAEELTPDGLATLAGLVAHPDDPSMRPEPLLDGVSVHKSLLVDDVAAGTRLVDAAHDVGLQALCFTLRPENHFLAPRHQLPDPARFGRWIHEFVAIMDTGVDAVFADHPDLACRARQERAAAPATAAVSIAPPATAPPGPPGPPAAVRGDAGHPSRPYAG